MKMPRFGLGSWMAGCLAAAFVVYFNCIPVWYNSTSEDIWAIYGWPFIALKIHSTGWSATWREWNWAPLGVLGDAAVVVGVVIAAIAISEFFYRYYAKRK